MKYRYFEEDQKIVPRFDDSLTEEELVEMEHLAYGPVVDKVIPIAFSYSYDDTTQSLAQFDFKEHYNENSARAMVHEILKKGFYEQYVERDVGARYRVTNVLNVVRPKTVKYSWHNKLQRERHAAFEKGKESTLNFLSEFIRGHFCGSRHEFRRRDTSHEEFQVFYEELNAITLDTELKDIIPWD